jgi:hypothetical protein
MRGSIETDHTEGRQHVYASEVFREQAEEFQRVRDERHLKAWVDR